MNEYAIYHKSKSNYAFPVSENKLQVRLRTAASDFKKIYIVYGDKYSWHLKQEKMMELLLNDYKYDYYQVDISIPSKRYTYYFKLEDGLNICSFCELGIMKETDDSFFREYFFHFPYIHEKDFHKIPQWVSDGVCYQIFPERFDNGNKKLNPAVVEPWGSKPKRDNFMGGDFEGIKNRLEYLKDLGINIIYLTPIFLSPSNHKYDIIDYLKIDPQFGTEEDFKKLIDKAHSLGIKIILDAVYNHCSPEFFAFKDLVKNEHKSKYKGWFHIKTFPINPDKLLKIHDDRQAVAEVYDNDWHIIDGKSILPYECFGFAPTMPKFNTANSEVRSYLINAGKYWIEKFDIDGWRLDVSNEIDHFFWREFRKAVKSVKEDVIIIGEIWEDGEPWLRGDQFDGIMNYGLSQTVKDFISRGIIGIKEFRKRINQVLTRNTLAANSAMLNLLDSHDTQRFLTEVNENEDKLLLSLMIMFTFPGIPMIYYGTEIGMTGNSDPDCRKCMDWDKSNWNENIFKSVKKLIQMYKTETALQKGDFSWVDIHENLISYKRKYKDKTIIVILNGTEKVVVYKIPDEYKDMKNQFNSFDTTSMLKPFKFKILGN